MQTACAKSKLPSEAAQLANARAFRLSAREEIEQFLFALLTHECKSRECRDCEVLDRIASLIQQHLFESRVPDRPILG